VPPYLKAVTRGVNYVDIAPQRILFEQARAFVDHAPGSAPDSFALAAKRSTLRRLPSSGNIATTSGSGVRLRAL
jgi:hypothetical protein